MAVAVPRAEQLGFVLPYQQPSPRQQQHAAVPCCSSGGGNTKEEKQEDQVQYCALSSSAFFLKGRYVTEIDVSSVRCLPLPSSVSPFGERLHIQLKQQQSK